MFLHVFLAVILFRFPAMVYCMKLAGTMQDGICDEELPVKL